MPPLAALWLALAPVPPVLPATLILFRDQAEPLLFKPMLSVDGVELGRLGQKRFIAVELSAGPHQLEARWPSVAGHKPATLTVSVTAGATSYVELTGTAAFWRTAAATGLVERPSASGKELVTACCKAARLRGALVPDGGGMDGSFVGE